MYGLAKVLGVQLQSLSEQVFALQKQIPNERERKREK